MTSDPNKNRATILITLLPLLLLACTQKSVVLQAENNRQVDFSGSWELDFQLSDRFEEKIELEYLLSRRAADRAGNENFNVSRRGAGGLFLGQGIQSLRSLIELGRFTEMITRSNIIEIEQTERGITIHRQDDYPLSCRFHQGLAKVDSDGLGTEVCGWDHHQLVFYIVLDDGLRVRHRLTLAPDDVKLNVATTVSSGSRSTPFTLNRVFTRFQPLDDKDNCTTTLLKKTVCTRSGAKP